MHFVLNCREKINLRDNIYECPHNIEKTLLTKNFAMSFQANAWIPSPSVAPAAVSAQQHHFNPFAPKSDSGFISPACNSHNHSASSEDSAENHEERVAAASVTSEDDEMKYRRDSGTLAIDYLTLNY